MYRNCLTVPDRQQDSQLAVRPNGSVLLSVSDTSYARGSSCSVYRGRLLSTMNFGEAAANITRKVQHQRTAYERQLKTFSRKNKCPV